MAHAYRPSLSLPAFALCSLAATTAPLGCHSGTSTSASTTSASASASTGTSGGGCKTITLTAAPSLTFPPGEKQLEAIDATGDGKADLITLSEDATNPTGNPGTLNLYKSKGDGTFAIPMPYTVGKAPTSFIVGDVNADGRPDALASNDVELLSLLGASSGGFNAPISSGISTSGHPYGLLDINGDQKPDLALFVDYADGTHIEWLQGSGQGTFQATATSFNLGKPVNFDRGDLNGDGKVDVVAVDTMVEVLIGKGDGTFAKTVTYPTSFALPFVTLKDLNGDGKLDVLLFSQQPPIAAEVLLGNGDGTFAAAGTVSIGNGNEKLIGLADFNGDGKPDIVVQESTTSLSILLGDGKGGFAPAQTFNVATPFDNYSARAADINGDGRADLVLPASDGSGAEVYLTTCAN